MIETADYRIQLEGTDPKSGKLDGVEDGLPTLEVASPPEFGGPGGVWSPEHLFVAAVSSCLMTTFRAIAAMSGVDVISYTDDSSGTLLRGDNRLLRIDSITLRPKVVEAEVSDVDRVECLLNKAEDVCLIGRSINTTVHLEPEISAVA